MICEEPTPSGDTGHSRRCGWRRWIGRRRLLLFVLAVIACGSASATTRSRRQTVKELVRGGRMAAVGEIQIDGRRATITITRVLRNAGSPRAPRVGQVLKLDVHPTWRYDVTSGASYIWIFDRLGNRMAFVGLQHEREVLRLIDEMVKKSRPRR